MDRDQFNELLEARTLETMNQGGRTMKEAAHAAAKNLAWELVNGKTPQYADISMDTSAGWELSEVRAQDLAQGAILSFGHGTAGPHVKVMCFQDVIERQVKKAAKEGFSHGFGIGSHEAMAQATQTKQMSDELIESVKALLASDPDVAEVTNEDLRAVAMDEKAEPKARAQAEAVLRVRDAMEDFAVKAAEQKNKTRGPKP